MIPRSRDLHAASSIARTRSKLSIGFLAALVSLAVAACAAGSDHPKSSASEQTTPPDPPTTIPTIPEVNDAAATEDASTSSEDAGRQDGGGTYTYGDWSEWSNCSVTCGEGTKTRTRECKRRDGLPVNCALCGGACTDTEGCSASTCCGTREECCPVMPYNVCGGTMTWCSDTLAQYAATCLAAGCLWTGAMACTIGGSVSNATLPGGMGTCQ